MGEGREEEGEGGEGEEGGGKGSLPATFPLETWLWRYPLETRPHEGDAAGRAEEDEEGEVEESVRSRAEQLAAASWYLENSALAKSGELIILRR